MGSMATRGFPNRFHGNEGVPQLVGHCSPQRRPSWRPRRLRKRQRRRRRRRRTRPEQGGECEQRVAVSGDKHLRKRTLRGSTGRCPRKTNPVSCPPGLQRSSQDWQRLDSPDEFHRNSTFPSVGSQERWTPFDWSSIRNEEEAAFFLGG